VAYLIRNRSRGRPFSAVWKRIASTGTGTLMGIRPLREISALGALRNKSLLRPRERTRRIFSANLRNKLSTICKVLVGDGLAGATAWMATAKNTLPTPLPAHRCAERRVREQIQKHTELAPIASASGRWSRGYCEAQLQCCFRFARLCCGSRHSRSHPAPTETSRILPA